MRFGIVNRHISQPVLEKKDKQKNKRNDYNYKTNSSTLFSLFKNQ